MHIFHYFTMYINMYMYISSAFKPLRCLFVKYLAFHFSYLTLYPLHPFSPGLPTGRNLRWQLLLPQQSSCQPVGEHLVPGGEGLAVGSARHACGRSVESATSVKT